MKRVFCWMLVLSLMMTMAVPCLAAENEDEGVQPYSTSSRLVTDNLGNRYTVMGDTSAIGAYGSVFTSFSISTYGGGDKDSISTVKPSVSTDATVVFYGITTPNYTKLDKSTTFVAGKESGQVNAAHTFTASISSLSCTHSFWTNSGASGSFNTSASA